MTGIDTHWTERALCLGEDPETFFPVAESGPGLEQVARAKAICRSCPVVRECLSYALRAGESAGVWGGATVEERRLLRWSGRSSGVRDRTHRHGGDPAILPPLPDEDRAATR